jgi:hypothetical protein
MNNSPITALLITATTLAGLNGCRVEYSNASATKTSTATKEVVTSTPLKLEEQSPKKSKEPVTISLIAIHGWWWSDEQLSRDFDADNPPPKKSYVRLDKWDASQPDSPHPDHIDVSFRLENHTNEPVDLSLEAFADFKVASYQATAQGAGSEKIIDERLEQTQWTNNRKLANVLTTKLQPGEAREAQFKDFNLRAAINPYFEPSAGDLWPWKLRVSFTAQDSKGVRIAYSEAIIDLVPGD